jgi:Beta-lactamase enzyme family
VGEDLHRVKAKYSHCVIATPPPPPPVVEQPAPYEISYGVVAGTAAPGTTRIVVRSGGEMLFARDVRHRRFHIRVRLPAGETAVTVLTRDARGRRAATVVRHVLGASSEAAPRWRAGRRDSALEARVRSLAAGFPGTAGIYVQDLVTGRGASWNARAVFPAASTLKLAIAVAALAHVDGTPAPGSSLDGLLRRMIIASDNAAANAVERYFGASTSGGSAIVNSLMRSLGLVDTEMYGGYTIEPYSTARGLAGGIPLRVERQPSWGVGKRTTAGDLAGLLRAIWLGSGGRGALSRAQPGFTAKDARYLLYLLGQVADRGKAAREIGHRAGVSVLHKAGWLSTARHENALVLWRGGAYVVTVMTYGGLSASDALAGRVARVALDRFSGKS